MRRLCIVLTIGLAAVVWPAASSAAAIGAGAQAVGSLEADFNNDGFADLAVGAPTEAIGNLQGAGAVNVLYGSAGGLTAPAASCSDKVPAASAARRSSMTSSAGPLPPGTSTTTAPATWPSGFP
jgi:hypothetical protein